MMKKVLFLAAFVAFALSMSAQSFSIKYQGQTFNEGDTLVFNYSDADNEIYFDINNLTDVSDTALLRVDIVEGDGLGIGVCIGVCVPRNIGYPFLLPAHGTWQNAGVMFVMGSLSEALVKASVYFRDQESDTLSCFIRVKAESSIAEAAQSQVVACPNPCQGEVTIRCAEAEGTLVICDLSGRQVRAYSLQGQDIVVSGLARGVYAYGIQGQAMRKLVVK